MIHYQGGSLEAFQEIYAQLAPGVRRYLLHLAAGSEIADDLLQETFLQMHRSRAAYNPKYAVRRTRPRITIKVSRSFAMQPGIKPERAPSCAEEVRPAG